MDPGLCMRSIFPYTEFISSGAPGNMLFPSNSEAKALKMTNIHSLLTAGRVRNGSRSLLAMSQ